MKVITSGPVYLDIDGYGGMIAYAELLNQQGIEAVAASTAPLNESVSKTVRTWPVELVTDYRPSPDDEYVLIDVSEPEFFDRFVVQDRVTGVIDHHPGLEEYWHQKIGERATIEFIGAACTLVFERWQAAELLDKMSTTSARLLLCGILDNTLNFGAKVTTDRDRQAYEALKPIAKLSDDWTAQYFQECQAAILVDPKAAVDNDTKVLDLKTSVQPIRVGQLVIWEAGPVLEQYSNVIAETLSANHSDWFLNLVSVGEGRSYFYSGSAAAQKWLTDTLGVTFESDVAAADRLWLRKEIIKADIERAG